ncbi:MAG: hypothetical protein QM817_12210 [Archangium sp.]
MPWDPSRRAALLAAQRNRKRLGNALLISFAIEAAIALVWLMPATRAVNELAELWRPREEAPTCEAFPALIQVRKDGIFLDGAWVAPSEIESPQIIEPLLEALVARNGSRQCVSIASEKQIAFRVIKAVMFTTTAAGYAEISFATM